MPIRTNRGRAAVYRRLWGWPLRSPGHLVAAVFAVTVLIVLVAVGVTHLRPATSGGGQAPAGPPVATTTVSGQPSQTRLASPPETPVSAPPAPAALAVVEQWGRAWVNHPAGMTSQQWLDQLKPYTTPEFLPVMSSVNLANVTATQVTGDPTVIASYTSSIEVLLPTDAGQLDITAILTPQGWLVSGYTEAN